MEYNGCPSPANIHRVWRTQDESRCYRGSVWKKGGEGTLGNRLSACLAFHSARLRAGKCASGRPLHDALGASKGQGKVLRCVWQKSDRTRCCETSLIRYRTFFRL